MKKGNLVTATLLLSIGLLSLSTTADAVPSDAELILQTGTAPGTGVVTLDQAPNFKFGPEDIVGGEVVYTTNALNPMAVSDSRGTGGGWEIKANITSFTDTSGTNPITLIGAEFILPAVTPTSPGGSVKPDDGVEKVLNTQDQIVLTAKSGEGLGIWEAQYDLAGIKVPSGNYVGTYKATMEWTAIATVSP
ncbi:WxL domain-containing protein [Carnobacterium gallinarum]|uniref:WxL domain-containing protein n=1 Tax=Carnobacterium gallinarum TaxID=2749 RepID=UPI000553C18C|nr:WxL domain-containing protein [Carnobacterium gallinarum]